MAQFGMEVEEDLRLMDVKLKQLKNEYEQYFLGTRPRPPAPLRGDVQKMFAYYTNVPIQRTALRFRFNTLQSRFFSYRRHWEATLRKIEEGTYERHVFKAKLHDDRRGTPSPSRPASIPKPNGDIYSAYVEARRACGQDTEGVSRAALQHAIDQQATAIRERYSCKDVRFRVVVEGGRAKLKATPVR
jgi:hypothetical protein